jgi:hypothetical protein
VCPARIVTRTLLTSLAYERSRLEFSCQYPGRNKIPPASRSPAVWSPVTMERSYFIKGFSAAMEMAKSQLLWWNPLKGRLKDIS